MTSKAYQSNGDPIVDYVIKHPVKCSEAQAWLLEKTLPIAVSRMFNSEDEMQLLANMCKAIKANKTLDIGSTLTARNIIPAWFSVIGTWRSISILVATIFDYGCMYSFCHSHFYYHSNALLDALLSIPKPKIKVQCFLGIRGQYTPSITINSKFWYSFDLTPSFWHSNINKLP